MANMFYASFYFKYGNNEKEKKTKLSCRLDQKEQLKKQLLLKSEL